MRLTRCQLGSCGIYLSQAECSAWFAQPDATKLAQAGELAPRQGRYVGYGPHPNPNPNPNPNDNPNPNPNPNRNPDPSPSPNPNPNPKQVRRLRPRRRPPRAARAPVRRRRRGLLEAVASAAARQPYGSPMIT